MSFKPAPASKCPKCTKTVYFAEKQVVLGKDWHKTCVKCETCNKKLEPGSLSDRDGKIYCKTCYAQEAGIKGYGFGGTHESFKSFGQGESQLIGGDVAPEGAPQRPGSKVCSNCGTAAASGSYCASCGNVLVDY